MSTDAYRSRRAELLIALAVFSIAFLFRLATGEPINDDYLHLTPAQQLVLGAIPVRDFIDPGEPLTYYASAAAQIALGRSFLSEALLDIFFLSLGHALVFVLAARASRSRLIGLLVTILTAVLVARLYSYPKVFLYAVGLLAIWRYIDAPRARHLFWVALVTAVAFLFRHDHGAYLGAAAIVAIVLVHWPEGARVTTRRLMVFATCCAALLLPFLIFIMAVENGGLGYVQTMSETARGEYVRTVGPWPTFHIAWTGGVPIDERTLSTTQRPLDPNISAWLYYLTVLLPPLTALVIAFEWWLARGHIAKPVTARALTPDAVKLLVAAVLASITHLYLLRATSDSAVADVSTVTAVLAAGLLARGLRVGGPIRWNSALVRVPVTLALLAVTVNYTLKTEGGRTLISLVTTLRDSEVNPLAVNLRALRELTPPYDDAAMAYVFNCTSESDRALILAAYGPDLYYAAGRGFAGGRHYFLRSFAPAPRSEAWSLARLRSERVPIVLQYPPGDETLAMVFPLIHGYVAENYRTVGSVHVGLWDREFAVLADKRIPPVGTYGTTSLPCYRQPDHQP